MRVLFVSGYTDGEIVSEGELEPGTDYLQKPFTREQLADKVREVLRPGHVPGKTCYPDKSHGYSQCEALSDHRSGWGRRLHHGGAPDGCGLDAYLKDASARFDWKAHKEAKANVYKVRVGQQKQKKAK